MKHFYAKLSIRKKLLTVFIHVGVLTFLCSAVTAVGLTTITNNWNTLVHEYGFSQGYGGQALTELTRVEEFARISISSTDPQQKQTAGEQMQAHMNLYKEHMKHNNMPFIELAVDIMWTQINSNEFLYNH